MNSPGAKASRPQHETLAASRMLERIVAARSFGVFDTGRPDPVSLRAVRLRAVALVAVVESDAGPVGSGGCHGARRVRDQRIDLAVVGAVVEDAVAAEGGLGSDAAREADVDVCRSYRRPEEASSPARSKNARPGVA